MLKSACADAQCLPSGGQCLPQATAPTDCLLISNSGNYIKPWEYWLGDKAYIGCPEFVTEFKKPIGGQLRAEQIEWNLLLQHYRTAHQVKSGHTAWPAAAAVAATTATTRHGCPWPRQVVATSTWCRP